MLPSSLVSPRHQSATLVTAEVVGVSVPAATPDVSVVALRHGTELSVSSKLCCSKSASF